MILQALYDYNARNPGKCADGWVPHQMDYLILLDSNGNYRGLRNLRDRDEKTKKEIGKLFLVPNIGKQVFKHTNAGNDPNLLWDNASFALGVGKNGEKKLRCFYNELRRWLPDSILHGPLVVLDIFLKNLIAKEGLRERILSEPSAGKELLSGLANISFGLDGEVSGFLEHPSVVSEFNKHFSERVEEGCSIGTCLISGKQNILLAPHHPVVKGMKADKDPNFISFNKPAFHSYGREKGANAPCSQMAVRGYSAALNDLLRDGSRHVLRIGRCTTLFWSETEDPFESAFAALLGFKNTQDPSLGIGELKQAMESLFSGQFSSGGDRLFSVLGIEAMGPRLAIRSWKQGPVRDVASSLQAWFKDLELIGMDPRRGDLSLRQLLQATAPHTKSKPFGDVDRIIPSIEPRLIDCALTSNLPFPATILINCVNRIRAEASIDTKNRDYVMSQRIALLKAYINRNHRHEGSQQEVTVSLDSTYTDQGYVLGRIFAVLERIQLASNNYQEVNSGIRDRFYGAFSSTPVTTYPLLMKLKNHHLKKIERQGEVVNLERMLGEIVDLLPPQGPPPHLPMEEQARFAIGYYHQRQALFTKSAKPESATQA
jgi:CRISPR-associated protein Csd1